MNDATNDAKKDLQYQSGFGNQFESEAVPGALPVGRNSPQQAPLGLYAELLSGSAFTAPRADNRRTWMYRRQPSVVVGAFEAVPHAFWKTGAAEGENAAPEPMRWHPVDVPDSKELALDFITGLRTIAVNGDAEMHTGIAAHIVLANTSMQDAFVNADAEMLLVPQQGALHITTELGLLDLVPGEIAVLPRGVAFKVAVQGPTRLYVCENYGAPFRLPELGPIGSNGLANARDFLAPVAAFESDLQKTPKTISIVKKYGGRLWRAHTSASPFNVVAWHGNLVPLKYDTARFMTIGSISFDHPDPSIFTVLTSPSDTPGTANCDFVIFPPRWLVAEDTFRPPWYHRNVMAEFMGLVHGQYDATTRWCRTGPTPKPLTKPARPPWCHTSWTTPWPSCLKRAGACGPPRLPCKVALWTQITPRVGPHLATISNTPERRCVC
jgi:homogentisate 1,2-dioxygenase